MTTPMNPSPLSRRFRHARSLLPLLLWLLTCIWMVWATRQPLSPTEAHAHTGFLGLGLGLATVELAAFYAITQPWRTDRPRWFAFISWAGCLCFAAWFVLVAFVSMQGGGVTMIHFFWLVVLGVLMLFEAVLTTFSALRKRR